VNQAQLKVTVNFAKMLSDHLEDIHKCQNDLYYEWLSSLPKLKSVPSENEDSPRVNFKWVAE